MRRGSRRGERGLLNQRVMSGVAVGRSAEEPMRGDGWGPVEANQAEVVAERDDHARRNWNRSDRGGADSEQSLRSKLGQRIELGLAFRTISDAGVFVDVFE